MPPFANPSEGVLGGGLPVPSVAWEILNSVRHYPHRPSSPSLGCKLYGPYMSLHIPTNLRVLGCFERVDIKGRIEIKRSSKFGRLMLCDTNRRLLLAVVIDGQDALFWTG